MTEEQIDVIKQIMGEMPYGASLPTHSGDADFGEFLVLYLGQLSVRLDIVAKMNSDTKGERDRLRRAFFGAQNFLEVLKEFEL